MKLPDGLRLSSYIKDENNKAMTNLWLTHCQGGAQESGGDTQSTGEVKFRHNSRHLDSRIYNSF